MESHKPKDLPFYETPDHVVTSAKIISQAKSQLVRSQLRPIGTKRPETPQEGGRQLFGDHSSRDPSNRPPSAFRFDNNKTPEDVFFSWCSFWVDQCFGIEDTGSFMFSSNVGS